MSDSQFESSVSELISGFRCRSEWYSNTLFVHCNEATARGIFHVLTDTHGLGHVLVSLAGDEYAFDFV